VRSGLPSEVDMDVVIATRAIRDRERRRSAIGRQTGYHMQSAETNTL